MLTLVESLKLKCAGIFLVFCATGIVGCTRSAGDGAASQNRSALLPGKVGPSGEVVMVVSESDWNNGIGAAVDSIFREPVRVLPQYEPRFDVIRLDPAEFDRFWKPHRNLIVFDIADRVDTQIPDMRVARAQFAKGQIYAEVKAKNAREAAEILLQPHRGAMLADLLEREEANRYAEVLALNRNVALEQEVLRLHGLESVLPKDARMLTTSGGFAWIERSLTRMKGGRNHDVQMGIVLHRTPYGGPGDFSMERMLHRRDSLLAERIAGPTPDSYMTTEYRLLPRYEEVSFRNGFAAKMRGIWKMEGDFMGGPWTSIAWVDEARGQLVTVDGYVYAPYFGKREYLREVESIVFSFAPEPDPTQIEETEP